MSFPSVSAVMSVYNGERFLTEAIDSILAQTWRDFEFLIVDDGSTDATAGILEAYRLRDPRVRVISQENRGLVKSLNRAIALATGEYVARMDADDVAMPERFAAQLEYLNRNRDVAVLGGKVEYIDQAGNVLGYSTLPTEPEKIHADLLDVNVMWHPTVLIRRDMLTAMGGYRNVPAAEDYDLWLRITDRAQLSNLPTMILKYRIHAQQVTVQQTGRMTLGALMSRGAAFARRAGMKDPIEGGAEFTPESLADVARTVRPLSGHELRGARTVEQQARLRAYWRWIIKVAEVGEGKCLEGAVEGLCAPFWSEARGEELADLRYIAGRLYWKQRRYGRSALASLEALLRRPQIAGRAIKRFLRFARWETPAPDPREIELS